MIKNATPAKGKAMSRRALLQSLPAATAALALTTSNVLAFSAGTATPSEVVGQIAERLAEAMAHPSFDTGTWSITIKSGDASQPIVLQNDIIGGRLARTLNSKFERWLELHRFASDDNSACERAYSDYQQLQSEITAMRPTTARDAAIMLVVETDNGESDFRDVFFARLQALAFEKGV